jgi:selenocysteine-specific elongation factor
VHDREVQRAESGQRVALGLPGIARLDVRRGDVLVARGAYPVSYRLDVAIEELEPIPDGSRLVAHLGTAHVLARVVRVGERWAQLRLSSPVVAARGDRVILRGETTVGGGLVLDPAPPRHRDAERMTLLERGDVAATVHSPVLVESLRHVFDGDPAGLERAGPWTFSREWLAELEGDLRARIEEADPIDPGIPAPSDAWAGDVLPLLSFERRGAKLYLPGSVASLGAREGEAEALRGELAAAGLRATKVEDGELTRYLEARGMLVRLGDGYAIGAESYEQARDLLLGECELAGEITLARFRDLAGVGRRDAQLLLERFDKDGLTRRDGDRRVLRRAAATRGLQ